MLLPEEEEYNRRLEEVDETLEVLQRIKADYGNWTGFYGSKKTVEELIFKIEQNKPQRRKIVEAKSIQGRSVFSTKSDPLEEVNETSKETLIEADSTSIWSKIVKFFYGLVGRQFGNNTPTSEPPAEAHIEEDTQSESEDKKDEKITLKGMEIPGKDSYNSTLDTNSNPGENIILDRQDILANIDVKKVERVLGIKIDPDIVFAYGDLTILADLIKENIEQVQSVIEEKLLKLKEASEDLDAVYDKRIGKGPTGKVNYRERVITNVRDDYRQKSWGNVRRICLDGFQNHLPDDSLGTKCAVEFLVGDEWVDAETAKAHRDEIKEVRFVDNGVGYSIDSLLFLGSNKTSEDTSAGQFGEGLKLIAMAAVNMGLGLELQSRNWSATATSVETTTLNTREGDKEEKHNALAFDVKVYDGAPMIGSKTVFHTPTQELIDYALDLQEKFVQLRDKKPEYVDKQGMIDIVETDKGGIFFVKGIHLKDEDSFFQYDFKKADVNPDRNSFNNYDYGKELESFFRRLEDINIMKKLLRALMEYQLSFEKELKKSPDVLNFSSAAPVEVCLDFYDYIRHKELWQQAFQEVCLEMGLIKEGQEAIIVKGKDDENRKIPDEYGVVTCIPSKWKDFLYYAGVKGKKDVIPEFQKEEIPTSLTLEVGEGNWNYPRVVIDAIQNHLPEDSNGKIFVRFQTRDISWHDISELPKFQDSEIINIKICDTGVGYDYKNLGLIASVKDKNGAGRFGEGLKMIALAILRFQREENNAQKIEYSSRDWIGIPKLEEEVLNKGQEREKKVLKLVFDVMKDIHPDSRLLTDGDVMITDKKGNFARPSDIKSKTIIHNPSIQMIHEFRTLGEKVLAFSDKKPLHSPGGLYDILDYDSGRVYVKGLLVEKRNDLLFSYNLKDYDIKNRDRNEVNNEDIDEMIRFIYKTTQDEKLISKYISEAVRVAQEGKSHRYRDFNTQIYIPPRSSQASLWISIFKEKYGENAGIVSSDNINYSEIYRAKHLGIKLIPIPASLYRALDDLPGMYGEKLPTYKTLLDQAVEASVPVAEEDLTTEEKETLDKLYKLNLVLKLIGEKTVKKIEVYDYPKDYTGKRAAGFQIDGEDDTIHLSRSTINFSLTRAADVFFHECDHMITGAEDPEARFRDCLSRWLGILALQVCDLAESVEDGGLYEDITMSDLKVAIREISDLLSEYKVAEAEREKRDLLTNWKGIPELITTKDGFILEEESGDDSKPEENPNPNENPNPEENPNPNENPNPDENPSNTTLDEIE